MSAVALPLPDYDGGDNSQPLRSAHWVDARIDAFLARDRRRTIRNWLHTKLPSGWVAANLDVEEPESVPYDWGGSWDMSVAQMNAMLQKFGSLAVSDAHNGCLFGGRLAWKPELWFNFKLLEILPGVVPTLDKAAKTITWRNVLPDGHMRVRASNHLEKVIRLERQPAKWPRLSVRVPDGCSWEIVDESVIVFYDPEGEEYARSHAGYGWWGGDENGPSQLVGGGGVGRVRFVRDADYGPYGTFRIVPVAGDWAAAWFPIYLDPTTTISGAAAITDNLIIAETAGTKVNNYGINPQIQCGFLVAPPTTARRFLMRVDSGWPTGTPTGFRQLIHQLNGGLTFNPNGADNSWFRLMPANISFAEGTTNGFPQVGASCSSYHTYDTQRWAGYPTVADGPSLSGTDYFADGSPPTIAYVQNPTGTWHTVTFPTSWASYFRDTSNTGMVVLENNVPGSPQANTLNQYYSADSGTNPTYFQVDYVVGPNVVVLAGTRMHIHDRR